MALHTELGRKGEQWACGWLVRQGFKVVARNWRSQRLEIDIVALRAGRLHFVEVKLRSSQRYGFPEQNITAHKLRTLRSAAEAYLRQHEDHTDFQIDVLSITLHHDRPQFYWISDVY